MAVGALAAAGFAGACGLDFPKFFLTDAATEPSTGNGAAGDAETAPGINGACGPYAKCPMIVCEDPRDASVCGTGRGCLIQYTENERTASCGPIGGNRHNAGEACLNDVGCNVELVCVHVASDYPPPPPPLTGYCRTLCLPNDVCEPSADCADAGVTVNGRPFGVCVPR
jgi:hypothetical protein